MPMKPPKHSRDRGFTRHEPDPVPENRPSACKRGYNRTWEKYRRQFLRRHPFCKQCEETGIVASAEVVDHIIPVRHGQSDSLFWDEDNHQPLCRSCHSWKTQKEDRYRGRASIKTKER